jgi:hypothetical protein
MKPAACLAALFQEADSPGTDVDSCWSRWRIKKGEEFNSSLFAFATSEKAYPMGVLEALAPAPEVSTRITPV